jgi:hypothetical protein
MKRATRRGNRLVAFDFVRVQDKDHYAYSVAEAHANEDSDRRPGQLQARVGRTSFLIEIDYVFG